jgi:hypothetical protein
MALEDIFIKDFLIDEEEEEEKFEWTPARKSVAERFGYTPPATTIPEDETKIPEVTEETKEITSLPELNNKIIQEYKALQTLKTKIDNADITLAGIPDEIKPSILYQYNQDKKQYDALNNSLNAHIIQRDIMNLPTENLGVLTYSPATMNLLNSALTTKEEKFTRYIKESAIKDDWDAFRLSAANYIHKSKQFFNSTLPNAVYREITPEEAQKYYPEFSPQMIEEINQTGEEKKKTYQEKYNKAEENYQKWIEENPELAPRPEWEGSALENIKRNPKLLLDPGYWGYVVAQSAAFTMGVMGTTLVGTALTGNPLLGMTTGLAVAYPAQAQDLYEELVDNGATPEDAAQLAVPVGALIAAVEVMGDLPILASVSAPFKNLLRQNITKEVGGKLGQSLAKKGLKTFATIEGVETLEEIVQEAMQNAAVKTVDENRSILENIPEVTIQTLMATAPLALLGVGGEINTETKIINRNLKIGYEQVKKITEMEAFAKEEEKEKPKVEPKPPEIELRKEAEKVKEEKPPEEAEIIPSKAEPLPPEIELKEKAETEIKKTPEEIKPSLPKEEPKLPEIELKREAFKTEKPITSNYDKIVQRFSQELENQGIYGEENQQKAQEAALNEILEGYRNLEEAKEQAQVLEKTGNVYYTARGYEVDASILKEAIAQATQSFGKPKIEPKPPEVTISPIEEKPAVTEAEEITEKPKVEPKPPEIEIKEEKPTTIKEKEKYIQDAEKIIVKENALKATPKQNEITYKEFKDQYEEVQTLYDRYVEEQRKYMEEIKKVERRDEIDDIVEGKEKIRVPMDKTEWIEGLGKGKYMKIFSKDTTLPTADEVADSLGMSENELRQEIIKRSREKHIPVTYEEAEAALLESGNPMILELKGQTKAYKDLLDYVKDKVFKGEPPPEVEDLMFELQEIKKENEAIKTKYQEDLTRLNKERATAVQEITIRAQERLEKAKENIQRLEAQVKESQNELNKLRGQLKKAKTNKAKQLAFKDELAKYIKEKAPRAIKNELPSLANVRGEKSLANALEKVDFTVQKYYKKKYIQAIKKELSRKAIAPRKGKTRILKGKFTAETQRLLDAIQENINKSRNLALEKIQENIKAFEAGEKTDIAAENELLKLQGIQDMTIGELQHTLKTIKDIKELGKNTRKIREDLAKQEREKNIKECLETITGKEMPVDKETGKVTISTVYKTVPLPQEKRLLAKAKKDIDKIVNWQQGWSNLMDKLSALDKTSKPYQSALSKFGDKITVARIANFEGTEKVIKKIQDAFKDGYGLKTNKEIKLKLAENKKDIDLGTFKNAAGEEVRLILNKEQLIKKAMQLEDPTLEKTFEKMLYTDEIKEAINKAVEGDRKYIENIREVYRYIWERVNPIYQKLYGIDFPYNQFYSGRILRDIDESNISESLLLIENLVNYATVTNPSLKARTHSYRTLKYDEATPSLLNYAIQMEHFIAFAEPLHDMRSFFNGERVRTTIKQYYGNDIQRKIDNFLNDIARDAIDRTKVIKLLDKIRYNFCRAILSKPIIALKQIPSTLAYMTEMPVMDYFKGEANFWKHPVKNYRDLMSISPYVRERFGKGFERDIYAAKQGNYIKTLTGSHNIKDLLMAHIQAGDKFAVVQGMWAKFYSETKGKCMEASKEEIEKAMVQATLATERTQPTFTVESLPEGLRGGSFMRLITMFQNQPNKYFRIIADNVRNFKYGRGSKTKAASNIVLTWVVLPFLFQLIGDAGKFKKEHFYRILLLGPLNDMLVFGQLAQNLYGWLADEPFDYEVSPVLSTVREIQYSLSKISKWNDPTKELTDEDLAKFVEHTSKAIGQIMGLPVPYAWQVKGAMETKRPEQLLWSEYVLKQREEGEKKEEKKAVRKLPERFGKSKLPSEELPGGVRKLPERFR